MSLTMERVWLVRAAFVPLLVSRDEAAALACLDEALAKRRDSRGFYDMSDSHPAISSHWALCDGQRCWLLHGAAEFALDQVIAP